MNELDTIKKLEETLTSEKDQLLVKKQTKPVVRRTQAIEIRLANLAALKPFIENGSFTGVYVSPGIDNEVGRIIEMKDGETKVEIQYFDGKTSLIEVAELMVDDKCQKTEIAKGTVIKVAPNCEVEAIAGKEFAVIKAIYPGYVEVEGYEGRISAEFWDVVENATEDTAEAVAEIESKPEPVELVNIQKREIADFVFNIGEVGTDEEGNTLYVGRLYQENSPMFASDEKYSLLLQTKKSTRFHGIRSQLVREYHKRTAPLKAGQSIDYDPWFLAFAEVNKDIYHPTTDEENTDDIEEDLKEGRAIRQRLGVADDGRIYTGYRRALAALRQGVKTVPIEVAHFDTEADFTEALIDANHQRDKTPEMKQREIQKKIELCSEAARKRQLSKLRQNKKSASSDSADSDFKGTALEQVAQEEGVSPKTIAKRSKIIQFIDNCKDRELATKVSKVFNMGTSKTESAYQLTDMPSEQAHRVADMIINKEAASVSKAKAKLGIINNSIAETPTTQQSKAKGTYMPPGAVPAQPATIIVEKPVLPQWLMRLVFDCLGEIDIDLNADPDLTVNAAHHFTGTSEALQAIKADWQIPNREGGVTVFANLYGQELLDWARATEREWLKGNLQKGILFVNNIDAESRKIFKRIACASSEIFKPIELLMNGKPYRQANMVAYYLGDDWQSFFDTFDPHADVRLSRWVFDTSYNPKPNYGKPVETTETSNDWTSSKVGSNLTYEGMRLSVIQSVDGTYRVDIDGEKVAEGITDKGTAQTVALNTANERLKISA